MNQGAKTKDSKQTDAQWIEREKETVDNRIAVLASTFASVQAPQSQQIPAYVTGVRRQYLEAFQAETNAKRDYDASRVLESSRHGHQRQMNDSLILNHVNALHQRQEHLKLDSLIHYFNEFEALVPTGFEQRQYGEISAGAFAEANLYQQRTNLATLTRKLEETVVEAAGQAAREKAALQATQAELDAAPISPRSQQEALNAVRTELNAWIEESLAACGMDESNLDPVVEDHKVQNYVSEQDIEKAYSEYVDARKRLVAATEDLSNPLPDFGEGATLKAERIKSVLEADTASAAEDQYSDWQDERSLKALRSYFEARLVVEMADTAEILQRLADESQLLPSYPVLTRADRPKNSSKHEDVKSDKLGPRVDAWSFAAEAADTVTQVRIDKEVRRGNDAVERTTEILQDMTLLHESAAKAHN